MKKGADVREGDRIEARPGDGALRRGTVLKVEDGGDYGQPGKVARIQWDGILGASWMNTAHLKVLAAGGLAREAAEAAETASAVSRGTRWEETPAGFRGESEDQYSAAVSVIAAVLSGQDKVQVVAPGWIVRGELFGPEIRLTLVPSDDVPGRAAVQAMKRFRDGRPLTFPAVDAQGREVRVTVPDDEVAEGMLDGALGAAGIRRKA